MPSKEAYRMTREQLDSLSDQLVDARCAIRDSRETAHGLPLLQYASECVERAERIVREILTTDGRTWELIRNEMGPAIAQRLDKLRAQRDEALRQRNKLLVMLGRLACWAERSGAMDESEDVELRDELIALVDKAKGER